MSKQTTNFIGNGSTIVKYILVMIATKTLTVAAAHGIHLPVNEIQLAEIIGYIIGIIIATIDAKYPNNIFNNVLEICVSKITEDETEYSGDDNDT